MPPSLLMGFNKKINLSSQLRIRFFNHLAVTAFNYIRFNNKRSSLAYWTWKLYVHISFSIPVGCICHCRAFALTSFRNHPNSAVTPTFSKSWFPVKWYNNALCFLLCSHVCAVVSLHVINYVLLIFRVPLTSVAKYLRVEKKLHIWR